MNEEARSSRKKWNKNKNTTYGIAIFKTVRMMEPTTSTAVTNDGRRRNSLISRRQKRGASCLMTVIAMMILLSSTMMIFVSAIKPVRNIQVTFRGQTYTVREGVTTVKELTDRFEKISGKNNASPPSEASLNSNSNKNDDNNNKKKSKKKGMIIWKGQILKPDDSLIKAGIKNGDHVMILPDEKETKATDMLAVYLFLLSSNEKAIEDAITKIKQEQPESFEQMEEMFHSFRDNIQHLKKQDVVDNLRTNFDLAYHRIRSVWEHPSLRQSLHDPDRIENYRKIISQNLSRTKFLNNNNNNKQSPNNNRLQNAINSPEIWKKEFTKFVAKAIRVGDTILEGILDLLLDVLKGKGSSSSSNANRNNSYYSTSSSLHQQDGAAGMSSASSSWTSAAANAHTTLADTFTDEMEDPSLANNLLFELSESEDDYEDDE